MVVRAAVIAAATLALASCGGKPPYALLTIDDPTGIAATATSLTIAKADDTLIDTRALGGQHFPVTMVLRWQAAPTDVTNFTLSASTDDRTIAGARISIPPFSENTALGVTLTATCHTAVDCGSGVLCYGDQACIAGICASGPCALDVCAGTGGIVTNGQPCILDSDTLAVGVCLANSCTPAVCGDGYLTSGSDESCDDHGVADGDGCSSICGVEPGYDCSSGQCVTTCGDGVTAGSEACDDANDDPCDGCLANCTAIAAYSCGDGLVCDGEVCDDAAENTNLGCDGCCRNDCTRQRCGDGTVDRSVGETCDRPDACSECTVTEHRWLAAGNPRSSFGVSIDRDSSAVIPRFVDCSVTACNIIDSATPGSGAILSSGISQRTVSRVNIGMQVAIVGTTALDARARVLFGTSTFDTIIRNGVPSGYTFELDATQSGDFIVVSGGLLRRYDNGGQPREADFAFPSPATATAHDSDVGVLGAIGTTGHFAVTWLDGASPEHLHARCFKNDLGETGVIDLGTGASIPQLEGSPSSGTYPIVFKIGNDLRVVSLSKDCVKAGAELSGFGDASEARLIAGRDGEITIVYVVDGDVFLRRFDEFLVYDKPAPTKLNSISKAHALSNVAVTGNGRIAVTWVGDDEALYVQRVDPNDVLLGSAW